MTWGDCKNIECYYEMSEDQPEWNRITCEVDVLGYRLRITNNFSKILLIQFLLAYATPVSSPSLIFFVPVQTARLVHRHVVVWCLIGKKVLSIKTKIICKYHFEWRLGRGLGWRRGYNDAWTTHASLADVACKWSFAARFARGWVRIVVHWSILNLDR